MTKLNFFDSTLRDGSHAIAHQLDGKDIKGYCSKINNSGVEVVIVGHGNGLGASSLQVGLSKLADQEMLKIAKGELSNTKLGVLLIPGFGTIKDDLKPALQLGVDLVCVASHCTEADITRQHLEYVRRCGKEAYGVLMMYHMTTKEKILEEALKMQSYGAMGVILMDSAGASTPSMVNDFIKILVKNLNIPIGFHAHNNLGMAVANSYIAIEAGATIIDGTLRGFGAGAGNCPLEVLTALLLKEGVNTELNLYQLMDTSDYVASNLMKKPQEISSISISSGMAGVFSAFSKKVIVSSKIYGVDVRDIFRELGERKVLAGQEDFIIEVAMDLAKRKIEGNNMSF